jgi:hypothetical protein
MSGLTEAEQAALERLRQCRELIADLNGIEIKRFAAALASAENVIHDAAEKREIVIFGRSSRAPPPRGSFRPPSLP